MVEMNFTGVLPTLSNDAYHACRALGSSKIKAARKSLAHFKVAIDGNFEVSSSTQEAFDLGTCGHSVVLEQSTDVFAVVPEDAPKRPSVTQLNAKKPSPETVAAIEWWQAFNEKTAGKILLSSENFERVKSLFEAFCNHPIAHKLVSASKIEQSYFWKDSETGLWLKTRPDGYCQDPLGDYIFNYKTTGRSTARPNDFARAIANLQYDISAAHEIAGVERTTGRKVQDYFFIVQEMSAPFALSIFKASPAMLERAEAKRRILLNQIAVAEKTGEYPGYNADIVEIDLPAWATASDLQFEEAI